MNCFSNGLKQLRRVIIVMIVTGAVCLAGAISLYAGPRRAWVTSLEVFGPRDKQELDYDNIHLYDFSIAHAWYWNSGWEVQLGGTLIDAKGTTQAVYFFSPSRRSDAIGLSLGPIVHWTPFSVNRFSAFIDLVPNVLYTYPEFPAGGTRVNLFGRVGLGVTLLINRAYALEVAQRWAHISNGGEDEYINPGWDGTGIYLSVRRNI
jgi:hypothetical protein